MIGIDMPMPNNCCECPLGTDEWYCWKTGTELPEYCGNGRLPDCPLIDLSRYEDDHK